MRYQTSASFLIPAREAEHLTAEELVIWLKAVSPSIRYYENSTRPKLCPSVSQGLIILLPYMRGSLGLQGISTEGCT